MAWPNSLDCNRSSALHRRKRRRRDLQALAGNSSTQTSLGLAIADPTTYWPAADVHVRCFYHQTQKKNIERKGNQHALFRGLFDRIDRAIALQVRLSSGQGTGSNKSVLAGPIMLTIP
jgi:hypothetical protein